MARKLTEFSNKVIKEFLIETLKLVPGIFDLTSDKDIQINKNNITISVACLPGTKPYEVCLMAQRTLYYALYRQTDGKRFVINIVIESYSEDN